LRPILRDEEQKPPIGGVSAPFRDRFGDSVEDLIQPKKPIGAGSITGRALEIDLKEWAKEQFKAAQRPAAWLLSAERLRDAAETILKHEETFLVPYLRARDVAEKEAVADAYSGNEDVGIAEIKAVPPNYPPAQLLYAFAIENVLKGIIVADTPGFIQGRKLNDDLKTHDLAKLAAKANFTVHVQERPVLEALSQLSVWAGRYPVARTRREYISGTSNPHELLDYGSAHPVMRMFFDRALKELENKLPKPIGSRFESLAVTRQPGT
jgi:hypothetical protein